jgi:Acetyl-coenzyme A synthetase N-terminus
MGDYERAFQQSLEDPDGFWAAAAKDIDWYREPDTILDGSNAPFYRWFVGGNSIPATTSWTATSREAAPTSPR